MSRHAPRAGGAPSILLNPPAAELGRRHAVLWGRARRYRVEDFPGPLSLKSVAKGRAVWETAGGRFRVDASSCLVLNEGRRYSLTLDSPEEVETFCVFFRRGFAEEVMRGLRSPARGLLEGEASPSRDESSAFPETLQRKDRRLSLELERLGRALAGEGASELWLEERMLALALWLIRSRDRGRLEAALLGAVRPSTRAENHRRLRRARDFMESLLEEPLTLRRIAREACLSPYHFHRLFTRAFGETPHGYLRRRRLERARDLLSGTDLPVTDICLETGFRSPGSFSNLFRRRYGSSPREYRRGRRKKSNLR